MGHEAVGQVVQVGGAIRNFQEGDTIVVPFSFSCGKLMNKRSLHQAPASIAREV
jgi:threonine dehydrogenase-like Zn-dependent dehydrogenase